MGVAKYLILTGETVSATEAVQLGLVDEVAPLAKLADAVSRRARRRDPRPTPPADLPEPWRGRAAFFAAHPVEQMLSGDVDAAGNPDLEKAVAKVRRKAPLALRLAERLIEEGSRVSLAEGLAMELEHLEEIFRTDDALEGLSSLGRRRPTFRGS